MKKDMMEEYRVQNLLLRIPDFYSEDIVYWFWIKSESIFFIVCG